MKKNRKIFLACIMSLMMALVMAVPMSVSAAETSIAATVGDTEYATLQAAVNEAKNGQTVQLVQDIQLTAVLSVKGNKEITMDLNGKTITGAEDAIVIEIGDKTTKTDTSVLTLTNSQESGKVVSHVNANKAAICVRTGAGMVTENVVLEFPDKVAANVNAMIQTEGDLTLKSGTKVTSTEAGVTVLGDKGKLTVNEGTEITGVAYAIAGNGSNGLGGTEIVINGGEITSSEGAAIYHPQGGALKISGGNITGGVGVQMCAGDLTITGSPSITATSRNTSDGKTGDGTITDGSAISIVNRNYPGGAPTLNITGNVKVSAVAGENAVKAYTWNSDKKTQDEWDGAKDKVDIAGGFYSSTINEELLADSVKTIIKTNNASYANTSYAIGTTAENVLANAKAGDTVTVLKGKSITVPDGVKVENKTGSEINVNDKPLADGGITTVKPADPTNPGTDPTTPEAKPGVTSPDTGDDSNMAVPAAAVGLALAVMAAVIARRRYN